MRDGRQADTVVPTNLAINPNLWDDKDEQIKSKVVCDDAMRTYYNDEARKIKSYLEKEYRANEDEVSKDWLKVALDKYYNPKKYHIEVAEPEKPNVIDLFDEFLSKHKLSDVRAK